jgi:hypothetical protein
MEHAFNGKWLRRAWLDNVTGWVGDLPSPTRGIPILGYEGVFSAQHGWAFAGGSFDGDGGGALNTTLASLHEHCRKPYRYGYAYICGPLEDPHPPQQTTVAGSNGAATGTGGQASARRRLQFSDAPGMWPAVNYPTVLGLLAINRTELAWEEYERNSLHWQAGVTPDIWIGLWTSADSVNADGMPSDWTHDFPALCMHRHAWPVHTLRQLLGVHYTPDGLEIRPALPPRLGAFEWATQLSSLRWDGDRSWSGHYAPAAQGTGGSVLTLRVDMRHVLPARTLVCLSVGVAEAAQASASLNTTTMESGLDGVVEVPVVLRSPGGRAYFAITAG